MFRRSYAIWPLVISIGAKFWLVMLKYRHSREIGSSSLMADAANDGVDMLSGIVALVALSLTLFEPGAISRGRIITARSRSA